MKLPEIPGTTKAEMAINPEKNKYNGLILVNSLSGRKYRKLQMNRDKIIPIKNDLDIFGFRGSRNAEKSKTEDKKDLKAVG